MSLDILKRTNYRKGTESNLRNPKKKEADSNLTQNVVIPRKLGWNKDQGVIVNNATLTLGFTSQNGRNQFRKLNFLSDHGVT